MSAFKLVLEGLPFFGNLDSNGGMLTVGGLAFAWVYENALLAGGRFIGEVPLSRLLLPSAVPPSGLFLLPNLMLLRVMFPILLNSRFFGNRARIRVFVCIRLKAVGVVCPPVFLFVCVRARVCIKLFGNR